jgi:hypothetical protein
MVTNGGKEERVHWLTRRVRLMGQPTFNQYEDAAACGPTTQTDARIDR